MVVRFLFTLGFVALSGVAPAIADQFGSGGNSFSINLVNIGNAGNPDDTGTVGLGGVSYDYRMGVTEVSREMVDKAVAAGLIGVTAGPWTGTQPAGNVTWYEAAAFVNWLNTSTGHQAAYNLTWNGSSWSMDLWTSGQAWQLGGENLFRNKDAYYFLPSEDEWYKAAYQKNDGATGNYWSYATQSNSAPTAVASGTAGGSAVYNGGLPGPSGVDVSGGLSAYGTRGQSGNIKEWMETAYDGVNDQAFEDRTSRGGGYQDAATALISKGTLEARISSVPFVSDTSLGFRVAGIIPEPTVAVLAACGAGGLLARRRRAVRQ